MKMSSLQTKLIASSLFFVLLTSAGFSVTYYLLARQEKEREFMRQIRTAFRIINDEYLNLTSDHAKKLQEISAQDFALAKMITTYQQQRDDIMFAFHKDRAIMASTNLSYFSRAAAALKSFGGAISARGLFVYGHDRRLLFAYARHGAQETVGAYLKTESGADTFVSLDDTSKISAMIFDKQSLPEMLLPPDIAPSYAPPLPDAPVISFMMDDEQRLGFNIAAPIRQNNALLGVFTAEIPFYAQGTIERYARLSNTQINLFLGKRLNAGTLPDEIFQDDGSAAQTSCQQLNRDDAEVNIHQTRIGGEWYYQGRCAILDAAQTPLGAFTVNLSRNLARQAELRILGSVLTIGGVISVLTFLAILAMTRRMMAFFDQIIAYIQELARGGLPKKMSEARTGEFLQIARNLNLLHDAVRDVTQLAGEIARGNMAVAVTPRSSDDALMQALASMVGSLREVAAVADEIASGNLLVTLHERSEYDMWMAALHKMLTTFKRIVTQVKQTAEQVSEGSRELRERSEEMSAGTSEQAAATEEVLSSMEEMLANISQNAENAMQTNQLARDAAEEAIEGGKAVHETVMAIRQIASKIAIIQDIASQTRLLSLNATIEASRAQDHGKAFGVVAAEVRGLADTTKTAAMEISELATSTVAVAEMSGELLQQLMPKIQKTSELVQDISLATQEQRAGAAQVNHAIQQLDHVTQQHAATAESLTAAAQLLSAQAEQLRSTIAFFRTSDDANVRDVSQIAPAAPAKRQPPAKTRKERPVESVVSDLSTGWRHSLHQFGDAHDNDFERF